MGNDRYEVTDIEGFQVTQLPYNGIVDSSRLKKWLEHKDMNTVISDSEGNTSEYEDYEFLEDVFSETE